MISLFSSGVSFVPLSVIGLVKSTYIWVLFINPRTIYNLSYPSLLGLLLLTSTIVIIIYSIGLVYESYELLFIKHRYFGFGRHDLRFATYMYYI